MTEKIEALRKLVGQFTTESFAGFFAYFIKRRPEDIDDIELNKFHSKLKDFFYLIGLNAFSDEKGEVIFDFNPKFVGELAAGLNAIKADYYPRDLSEYTTEAIIHEMAFRNHFDNGVLSYVEQDLEKLRRVFIPFDERIIESFGIDVDFLIEIYKITELVSMIKFEKQLAFTHSAEFFEFNKKRDSKDFVFTEAVAQLPENIREQFYDFHAKPHSYLLFSKEDLYRLLPRTKVDAFLSIFSCKPNAVKSFNYYTDNNPLELAPILQLAENTYLHICQRQIPVAVYKFLFNFLQKDVQIGPQLIQHRNRSLEKKVFEIFHSFMPKKQAFFYENYCVREGYEQDLLILYKGNAVIVETKAAKLREPFRDIQRAVVRLESDFKEAIQYGYDQCERVEAFFLGTKEFTIMNEKGQSLYTVNPSRIHSVYSIVVTLERFGCLQTDLSLLLKKQPTAAFPWAVYIDDLEIFLLALRDNFENPQGKFIDFLRSRRHLHDHLHAIDELDVCARFLKGPEKFAGYAKEQRTLFEFSPHEQALFDEMYYSGGLSFKENVMPDHNKYSNR